MNDADPDAAGIEEVELNRQHELLKEGFRRFVDAVRGAARDSAQRDDACGILRELLVEVGAHFGFEESLMAKSGYPEFDHHLRQHLSMMTELGLLLDRLAEGADPGVLRQIDFVNDWHQRHVDLSDRKFFAWLAAHNS